METLVNAPSKNARKKIKKQEEIELNKEVEKILGKEGNADFNKALRNLIIGFKHLVVTADYKKLEGGGKDLPPLMSGLADNVFGQSYAGTQNGKPHKVLTLLREFKDKTNFS